MRICAFSFSATTNTPAELDDLIKDVTKKMQTHRRVSRHDGEALLAAMKTNQSLPLEESLNALHCFGRCSLKFSLVGASLLFL